MEKRNDILKCLYVHSSSFIGVDGSGLFSIDREEFSSQLLVAVNRLSSDEANIESVRRLPILLLYYLAEYLLSQLVVRKQYLANLF